MAVDRMGYGGYRHSSYEEVTTMSYVIGMVLWVVFISAFLGLAWEIKKSYREDNDSD